MDSPPLCWSLLDTDGSAARWVDVEHAGSDDQPAGPTARTTLRLGGRLLESWDAMLACDGGSDLVRLVRGTDDDLDITHELRLGGFDQPWVPWDGAHAKVDGHDLWLAGGETIIRADGTAVDAAARAEGRVGGAGPQRARGGARSRADRRATRRGGGRASGAARRVHRAPPRTRNAPVTRSRCSPRARIATPEPSSRHRRRRCPKWSWRPPVRLPVLVVARQLGGHHRGVAAGPARRRGALHGVPRSARARGNPRVAGAHRRREADTRGARGRRRRRLARLAAGAGGQRGRHPDPVRLHRVRRRRDLRARAQDAPPHSRDLGDRAHARRSGRRRRR